MKAYPLDAPPKSPGIYGLRHKETKRIYIGKSVDLRRRYLEWRTSVSTGLGIKSSKMQVIFGETGPEEWEFLILAELPTADAQQLQSYESKAIERVMSSCPDKCLNTMEPKEQRPKQPRAEAMSRITHEGNELTRRQAAELLGCTPKTVSKRLARWRGRGVYEISLDQLKALSEKYRV